MNGFFNWFVIVLVVGNLAACYWLIRWTARGKSPAQQGETTGHVWDGNLREWNNPMPRWWLWLFYLTIIFAFLYLLLYPGFGNFPGLLHWSSHSRYEEEMAAAEARLAPLYDAYAAMPIPQLAMNRQAMDTGRNLFVNNCTQCHGSDARGAVGFPNLRDDDWLYGGSPQTIETTILNGRNGVMPPWGAVLSDEQLNQVVAYVLSLSGRDHDAALAEAGKQVYTTYCAACHQPNGKGLAALGAPDLTDDVWLHGGSPSDIRYTIVNGRMSHMPAQGPWLGPERVHVLAAYIYSLSHPPAAGER